MPIERERCEEYVTPRIEDVNGHHIKLIVQDIRVKSKMDICGFCAVSVFHAGVGIMLLLLSPLSALAGVASRLCRVSRFSFSSIKFARLLIGEGVTGADGRVVGTLGIDVGCFMLPVVVELPLPPAKAEDRR